MATAREKLYDEVIAPGIEYIRGKKFKIDIFTGSDPEEKAARDKFFHDFLHRQIVRGESKDKRFTSIYDAFQWLGPTFDVVYAKVTEVLTAVLGVGAKVDALQALVVKALADGGNGAQFDAEKFLADVRAESKAGTLDAIGAAAEGLPATLSIELGRPDTVDEAKEA